MKNCWEYKKCGREIDGINAKTLGICSAATDLIIEDITTRKNTEEEKLLKSESKLQELINELSCIYQLLKLIENKSISIEGLLHGALEILPAAFRFSDICCARISYNGKEYTTINFKISKWMLSTREVINEKEIVINVIYLEDKPFQEEEYDMLREIGIRLKSCMDEREASQKLKESEEKHRYLVNSISDLLLEVDLKGRFTYASPQLYEIFGFTPSELINKSMRKFIHPDDIIKVLKALKDAYRTREAITIEYRTLHKDGHYVYASAKGSLLDNGRFYGVVRDISKRKIVEQKLRESEEKYRLISENAYDLIGVLNNKFKYEYINEGALQQLLGYKKDEILGESALKFIHPDDWKLATKFLFIGLKKHQGEAEIRLRHKNGSWVWFEVRRKTFLDKDGKLKVLLISRDFTERKEIMEKLRESEERYRLISQNADENLFTFDMNLNLTYSDSKVPNILGYSYEEIRKLKLTEYNTPASLRITLNAYKEELRNERKKLKDAQRIRIFEIEQIHKNGSIVNVETRFTFLRDKDGKATGILGISRNITKRKQAENKLKESEEKFRLISENAYDLIGLLNKKFKYEYINENAFQQTLGYSSQDLLGKSALKFVHRDDISMTAKALFEGFKEGQGDAELRFKHKDGHWVWIEARGKTFINEDGDLNAIIFSRDISERKRAEEELKYKAQQWLTTFNAMRESVVLLDLDNTILQCNKATLNLVGKPRDDIINRPCWEIMHGTDQPVDWCPVTTMKTTGKVETSITQVNDKWFQITANPVFDDNNQLIGSVHVITDITDNKEAALRLQESEKQSHDAYERANFYKDLFAHDINNILQIITSSAELISIKIGDSENSKSLGNLTKIIIQQVERGGKLVKNVHTLSKLEEKNIIIQPINLYDTLKNSIEFVKGAYEDRNLEIQVNSTEIDFVVHANILLQDVFENILINSVKYNESSDIEILVKLTKIQMDSKNYIKMEFIDNGMGVPDERKEIIFRRGNRKLKGDKGMGLGLSLVSKILTNFDGKIWVEDRVSGDYSKGSNFIIILQLIR